MRGNHKSDATVMATEIETNDTKRMKHGVQLRIGIFQYNIHECMDTFIKSAENALTITG